MSDSLVLPSRGKIEIPTLHLTLIGALIIQLVRYTLLSNGVPDDVAKLVKALLIVVAVWLQRQGRS